METKLKNYLSQKLDRLQKLAKIIEGKPTRVRIVKIIRESENWTLAAVEFSVKGEFNYIEDGILFKNAVESPEWLLNRWIANLKRELNEEIPRPNEKEDLPM